MIEKVGLWTAEKRSHGWWAAFIFADLELTESISQARAVQDRICTHVGIWPKSKERRRTAQWSGKQGQLHMCLRRRRSNLESRLNFLKLHLAC